MVEKHWKDYYHRGLSTKDAPSLQEASFRNTIWTLDRYVVPRGMFLCRDEKDWKAISDFGQGNHELHLYLNLYMIWSGT